MKHHILTTTILAACAMIKFAPDNDNSGGSSPGGAGTLTQVDLTKIDYCVVVDKSGSMGVMSGKEGSYPDRYTASKETVKALVAEMATIDTDGISGGVFGTEPNIQDGLDYPKFAAIFDANKPSGGTTIISTLNAIFGRARESMKKGKQFLAHIIWDGAPSDAPADIAKCIAAFTQEMTEDGQVAIQFLQVGNASDEQINAFTTMLDDELVSKYGAKFDIVDCKPLNWINEQANMQAVANEAFNG